MILDAVSTASPHVSPQVGESLRVVHDEISRDDLQAALGLSGRKSFRERYLKPALALDDGLIDVILPDKPTSSLQRYLLTDRGHARLAQQGTR